MDGSNSAVIDAISSRKALPTAKRQHRSLELKRQIVEETLAAGASVARVARAHGVNANQVFAWRRQYQQGLLKPRNRTTAGLLAVRLTEAERTRVVRGENGVRYLSLDFSPFRGEWFQGEG